MVETTGEVSGMKQPGCGSALCKERVEGCRVVLSVCFGLHGNMQLEELQGGP